MAIIVDPDNLDRHQIIFGSEAQKISIYPSGTVISPGTPLDGYDGYTVSGQPVFYDLNATFQTDTVAPGDILGIYTEAPAGHYIIASVDSEVRLTLTTDTEFTAFDGYYNPLVYDVREPTGGSSVDGITLQAVYSFGKEEWRFDQTNYGGDDLIRHEFPFEAVTREQMEIGGTATHADWEWFNNFTRKKIRTGGWAARNTAGTTLNEYTGIITLGALDADTQVYYQQQDGYAPIDFDFLGPVNEPIFVFEPGDDRRSFLKLFARKKQRTYAQAEISDIGVTTIETLVNRFPLSHVVDPAIVATDGQVLGASPFRDQVSIVTGSDGSKTISGITFTSAGSTFQTDEVVAGDVLQITSGTETGYYTIASVDSETALTIAGDFEFDITVGWASTENTLDFDVQTTIRAADKGADGVADDWITGAIIETGTPGVGTLTDSANGSFVADGVVAGDLLRIVEDGYIGLYKVLDSTTTGASDPAATVIYVDTSDQAFPGVSTTAIDYQVYNSGMYLQFKADDVPLAATGSITFANADPDTISRASGSWITDGIEVGDVITIVGSASNDGSYTVAQVTSASVLTLVATDELTAEGPIAVTTTATRHFKRDINGVTYAFSWRVLGNNSTLNNIYQFIQHELRQSTDIDYSSGTSRGDVTDLLMSFSTPTGTMFDAFIDELSATDLNNVTYIDATGESRAFAFIAAGTLSFNANLQNDTSAVYRMFFSNDDTGDNLARDFSTPEAITVQNADSIEIAGNVGGAPSVSFTFDYDGNVQRGSASAGTDAPITVVAIGLDTAQYVIVSATIERSKANNVSLVASLERTYSNP